MRPFRAYWYCASRTQGVALGCHVAAPLGRSVTKREVEIAPVAEIARVTEILRVAQIARVTEILRAA